MPNVRYTISFPSKETQLIQFMEDKVNSSHISASAYIRDLIRKDMESSQNSDLEQIYSYVIEKFKKDGYIMTEQSNAVASINEEDKNVIMGLF